MRCKRCKCKVCSCIKNDVPKIAVNGIVQNQNENDVVNIKVPTKTSQLINDSGFGQGGQGNSKIENIRVNGKLVSDPSVIATNNSFGLVKKGVSVPNGSDIDTLLVSLRNAGIIDI